MAKKLYIGVMIVGVLSFSIYYFLGGFEDINVNQSESLSFRVVGTYFYGKYDDHQLERNFKKARDMIVKDQIAGDLCVVTYQSDSLKENMVSQFIGVALAPGIPLSGELFEKVDKGMTVRTYNSQTGANVLLDMHPIAKPNPAEVQSKLVEYAKDKQWEKKDFFVELYHKDNTTSIYLLGD